MAPLDPITAVAGLRKTFLAIGLPAALKEAPEPFGRIATRREDAPALEALTLGLTRTTRRTAHLGARSTEEAIDSAGEAAAETDPADSGEPSIADRDEGGEASILRLLTGVAVTPEDDTRLLRTTPALTRST